LLFPTPKRTILSMNNKKEQLRAVKARLQKDMTLPLRETATQIVFGEGNPDADIYFLGEAPGKWEDLKGRPFIGLAGKLLEKLLTNIQLTREDVYISNIVRFRPPNNRPPTASEIAAFAPSVIEEITIINPKLVIPLGRFAMEKFLPDEKISHVHGKAQTVTWQGKMIRIMPMYHPAAAFRSTKVKNQLTEDFQTLGVYLKKLK
jgi:uracil-DNA glycosylase family 4